MTFGDEDETASGRGSALLVAARQSIRTLGGIEVAALVLMGAFTVVRSTTFTFPTTPRLGVLLLLGVPGLGLLVRAAIRRDGPSTILIAFLLSAVVSALLSGNAIYSLKGEISSSGTVLVWALALGWFGVGTAFTPDARAVLPWVIVGGATLNGLVGIAQLAFSIERGPLATFPGRASGLMDNPVYYGSFFAGVAAWAVVRASARGGTSALALVAIITFFMGLSGSRSATIALVVVSVAAVVGYRRRSAIAAVFAAAAGLIASWMTVSALGNASSSAVNRFGSGEGIGGRTQIWRYGLEAFADRPVFGWGMNRYGAGTWPKYSLQFVRDSAWDDQAQSWADPHNVAIYLLATVGVVGVGLLLAFVVILLRRRVDPALAAFALGSAASWLLQPTTIHVLPVMALMLGAARPALAPVVTPTSRSARAAFGGLVVFGALCCAYVVVADYRLSRAIDSGDLARVESAAKWYVRDPQVTDLVSSRAVVAAASGIADTSIAVRWAEKTVELVPDDPRPYGTLALRQFADGDTAGMAQSLTAASGIQQWNPTAASLNMLHAVITEDAAAAADAAEVICQLELDVCEQARKDAAAFTADQGVESD